MFCLLVSIRQSHVKTEEKVLDGKKKLIRIPEIHIIQTFSCVLLLSFINFNWFT